MPVSVTRRLRALTCRDGLRRHHDGAFRGADAEGQRPERSVGGSVAVATSQRDARKREPLLRTDDVDDALPLVVQRNEGDRVAGDVVGEPRRLRSGQRLGDGSVAAGGGDRVVGHRQARQRTPQRAARLVEGDERLRGAHLVEQVPVDVEERRSVAVVDDDMALPQLVVEGAGSARRRDHGVCANRLSNSQTSWKPRRSLKALNE